jgi:predicted Zn-dependent peptidase
MAVILMIAGPASAQTKVEDIREFTLKNGLKFVILEDHSIPNANMYIFFKVGSRNEYPGITGLSHFFEHMMFNGAEKYGPKEFDRVMEAAGGANNAYTNENLTVYTDFFPSSALEVIFDLEADRIGRLALDKKMVESERGVVLSEWTTACENSNSYILSEQVKGAAFLAHPYRWTVLGYESDIRNWSIDDLQRYFDTYYAPNNALVVMVGDINFERVKKMTRTYFESIPSRQPPRPVHTIEPEQRGEKRVYVNKSVSSPNLMIAYHVPQTGSNDYYALDMLDSILSAGKSSRFYSSLVSEQQLALRVSAYMPFALDPNLFYISAVCAAGVDAQTLEKAIYKEIDKIIAEGVSERELQKVKNTKLAGFYRSMETIDGKANTIGAYEIYFGSYKKLFNAPEEYKKVTPDDVKAAAAKYFKKSNRTVGILQTGEEK